MLENYIKVTKPSGVEEYKIITSFELNTQQYVVLDSKLKDANQNTIVFISRINGNNLENITDDTEWSSVKSALINLVKGDEANA